MNAEPADFVKDAPKPRNGVWTISGFESFRRGTFGNAGQNLYVSRAGVLQRIHQYDLNQNGYLDLVFCNSQNNCESPPAYVYQVCHGSVLRRELPASGARSACIADLSGDGYDDLVIGNYYDGVTREGLNAQIYYGSPSGWTERHNQLLPAPWCISVAAGDLDGDGRVDLAFLCTRGRGDCRGTVRLFFQTELGFEPKRYRDTDISGQHICIADLDGDGCAELIVRSADGNVRIYWGAADGPHPERASLVPVPLDAVGKAGESDEALARYEEHTEDATPLVKVIDCRGSPHVFVARPNAAYIVPVMANRAFGIPIHLKCSAAMSVAVGDLRGAGEKDLIVACREPSGNGERSWIYWGKGEAGYSEENRTSIRTCHACDVAVADLNGSGRDDIVICQNHDGRSYTTESLVFLGGNSVSEPALHLRSHDARRVLVGHSARQAEAEIVLINHITRSKLGNVDNAVYYGGPDGYRADRCQSLPGWGSVEAVYADLDDDGRADLVFANASENSTDRDPGSYIYLNSEQGFAMQPSVALPTTRAHGVACADLNRNGYLDLVFGGFDNPELLIFYGSPGGWDVEQPARIWMEHEGVLYKEPRWVHLADLNNDGYLDLIVPQSGFDRFFILWGGPERFSMDRCQFLSVFRAVWTQAVDLSGNGYLDLLIGSVAPSGEGPHDSFVYIYWNSAAGLSGSRRTMLPANHVNCMALADFNHNGRLDLFVGSYADGRVRDLDSYIYWNRPGTFFSSADRTRLFTHSASGCLAADFDGNGWSDLVVANHKVWGDHVGYSEVWWNGPDGFSPKRTTRLPTSGPHGMAAVGPGSITTRGPEEYYVSPPFKLPSQAVPREVSWQAEIPPGTWVRAQLRFADSKAGLKEAEWVGPAQESSWFDNHASLRLKDCAGWWMQVRLALGATNSLRTPRVTRLDVRYGVPEKRRGARSG